MKNIRLLAATTFATVSLGISSLAIAEPVLQLGIAGGTYNAATQTIVSTGPIFSLYAYLNPNSSNTLTDTYYLSMALSPQVSSSQNLGSFSVNGNTINATTGMTYGVPPLDTVAGSGSDPGDLATHSVFPTYFSQLGFSFSSGNRSGLFNTADHPSWGPQSGTGMYFAKFDVNTTNLAGGYAVHFDLYNTKLCTNTGGQCNIVGDVDVTQFAPFSHDAQSAITTVPEPGTMLLMGLGLLGLAFVRRRA